MFIGLGRLPLMRLKVVGILLKQSVGDSAAFDAPVSSIRGSFSMRPAPQALGFPRRDGFRLMFAVGFSS